MLPVQEFAISLQIPDKDPADFCLLAEEAANHGTGIDREISAVFGDGCFTSEARRLPLQTRIQLADSFSLRDVEQVGALIRIDKNSAGHRNRHSAQYSFSVRLEDTLFF